jgi:uncharacterized membrane protein YagU involved in acid resistance
MNYLIAVNSPTERAFAGAPVFWAGLLCGVLDITAAFVTWGVKGVMPVRILQGIASGLLGPKSFQGGLWTAALGGALHFLIAFVAAAVFYTASLKLSFMTRHAVAAGVFYGVLVYAFMYWVVVPLSRVQPRPFSWSATVIAIITHMVCVGLPISLVIRSYSK